MTDTDRMAKALVVAHALATSALLPGMLALAQPARADGGIRSPSVVHSTRPGPPALVVPPPAGVTSIAPSAVLGWGGLPPSSGAPAAPPAVIVAPGVIVQPGYGYPGHPPPVYPPGVYPPGGYPSGGYPPGAYLPPGVVVPVPPPGMLHPWSTP